MDNLSRKLETIDWLGKEYKEKYLQLASYIYSGNPCIFFIGSGISKSIYPDWEALVTNISEAMSINLTSEEKCDKVGFALQILEKCKDEDHTKFYSLLRKLFDPKHKDKYKPLHLELLKLPVSGFITTNIDVCLINAARNLSDEERLYGFHYYPDHLPVTDLKERKLFHIHGVAINHNDEDTIESTILTESDYRNGYQRIIGPFLDGVFKNICVVFIGFSLKDPAIQKILESCKEYQEELKQLPVSRTSEDVNHYIITKPIYKVNSMDNSTKEDEEAESREDEYLLDTYNVHVIRYPSDEESDHTGLNKIINNLIFETKRQNLGRRDL